ncbi:hypothetical protein GCM10010145_66850 [Streptomyces ruber]|uniref:DUF4239 domain-containing protein n=2 Tax=Streptomyces TaxID=1883 RepID=A0A918BT62_9ACTN|nr:DUF4239 domain-containing protein [Streptomyces ruber]GGQ88081.1 hypothetical protein GCM10010145_66850 [Streptomyces ruber]
MLIVTVVVAAAALLVGIALQRVLRRRESTADDAGLSVKDLVGPVQTLTVLILAFVLATAASSYGKAEEAVRSEANAVDKLAEVTDYVPAAAQRSRLLGDIVCYTRAVRHFEWPAMADGTDSAVPSVWSTDLRRVFKEVGTDQPAFGMLVSADDDRSRARQARLSEATASVPPAVYWFMLLLLAVTIVSLALCIPRRNNRPQIAALAVATVLLTATLALVHDTERPFGGLVGVDATAITDVQRQATRDYQADNPDGTLPCTTDGDKTDS